MQARGGAAGLEAHHDLHGTKKTVRQGTFKKQKHRLYVKYKQGDRAKSGKPPGAGALF
jgi:hypothetical protein